MENTSTAFESEVEQGERFEFGKNWKNFLAHLNDNRIAEAEKSLTGFLGDISNKTFVDVGSGSGLFSLAARNLGARVFSLDYDPSSVYCTKKLKEKFYMDDPNWKVEQGSVLDADYIKTLGKFDIVYSWGVLHHTGKMWEALKNVEMLVAERGILYIAIYNKQGWKSKYWTAVKKIYNKGFLGKALISSIHIPYFFVRAVITGIKEFKNPTGYFSSYKKNRGMSVWHDWIDWLGGYPFETASPKEIEDLYSKNYTLMKAKIADGLGCSEFVFKRT